MPTIKLASCGFICYSKDSSACNPLLSAWHGSPACFEALAKIAVQLSYLTIRIVMMLLLPFPGIIRKKLIQHVECIYLGFPYRLQPNHDKLIQLFLIAANKRMHLS